MSYRTRRSRERVSTTLDSFTLSEQLDFMIGWLPGRGRWSNWQEYAGDYAAVRDELLASVWMADREKLPFAELGYQRWGAAGPPPGTDVRLAIQTYRNIL